MDLISSHMLLLENESEDQMLERALRESQRLYAEKGGDDDDDYDVIVIEDSSGSGEQGEEQRDTSPWLKELDVPDEFWDDIATDPSRVLQVYHGEEARGFDVTLGQHWIYPTNCELRQYQYDIVKQALFNNTLVSLPTGLGKTLIAAVVMFNFYRWYPQGKVLFLAPTKPLVAQQIHSCYRVVGIPAQDTAELTGQLKAEQRDALWRERRVFFATPQVVTNDLARGGCRAEAVCCVVFDEAHRAQGEYSYCQVVRMLDMFNKQYRVLALSATPGSNLQAVQQVVKNLKISHLELRGEESPDVKPYVHQRNVEVAVLPLDDRMLRLRDRLLDVMEEQFKLLRSQKAVSIHTSQLSKFKLMKLREHWRKARATQLDKRVRGLVESDFAVGMSLCHMLEVLCVHGVRSFVRSLDGLLDKPGMPLRCGAKLQSLLEEARNMVGSVHIADQSPDVTLREVQASQCTHSHPKMEKLEQVVLDHFQACQHSTTATRVIVFAQYRDSAVEICHLLQRHYPLIKPMKFIGQFRQGKGGFSQKQQLEVVHKFCSGGYNTLVSTCVGEEGLDIGEVDLIVCFDTSNCVRMKQRMGRTGRKRTGRIVMLLTQGKEYQKYMKSVWQTKTISKHLLQLDNLRPFLYQHSPSMLPPGVSPQCLKMFLTIEKKQESSKEGSGRAKADMRKYLGTTSSPYLSSEELAQLGPEPVPSFDHLHCLRPGQSGEQCRSEDGLEWWVDWQLELQPRFLVEHSRHSEVLVELLQRASTTNLLSSQVCRVASQFPPRIRGCRKPRTRPCLPRPASNQLPVEDSDTALASSTSRAPKYVNTGIRKRVQNEGRNCRQGANMRIVELITQTARTEQDKIIENIFKDFRHKLQVFREEWQSVGGLTKLCSMSSLKAMLQVRRRYSQTKANRGSNNVLLTCAPAATEETAGTTMKKKVGMLHMSLTKETGGKATDVTAASNPDKIIALNSGNLKPCEKTPEHNEVAAALCEKLRPSAAPDCGDEIAATICEALQAGAAAAWKDGDGEKQQQQEQPLHFDLTLSDLFNEEEQSMEMPASPAARNLRTDAGEVASPVSWDCRDLPSISPIPRHDHSTTLLLTPPRDSGERDAARITRPEVLVSPTPTLRVFQSNLPNVVASTPKVPRNKSAVVDQVHFDMFEMDQLMQDFEEEVMVENMDELREQFKTDVSEQGSALSAEQFCCMLRDPGSELYVVSSEVRRQMEVIYENVREPWQFGTHVTKVTKRREVQWWQNVLKERKALQDPAPVRDEERGERLPDISFLERSQDAEQSRVRRRLGLSTCGTSDDSTVEHPRKRRRQAIRLDLSDEADLAPGAKIGIQREGVKPCQFLDLEADVSVQRANISSDEDTSGLDSYDSSFVDDLVTDAPSELQTKYLHSIIRSPALPLNKPFKRPLPRKCDILSQVDANSDSSYEQDSFCVDDDDKTEASQLCPLELAEAALERGLQRRKSQHTASVPNRKRQRIISGMEDGSSDEDCGSNLHKDVSRAEEDGEVCKRVVARTFLDHRTQIAEGSDGCNNLDGDVIMQNEVSKEVNSLSQFNGRCNMSRGESEERSDQRMGEMLPHVQLKCVTDGKLSSKSVAEQKTVSVSDTSDIGSINFDFLTDGLFEEEFEFPAEHVNDESVGGKESHRTQVDQKMVSTSQGQLVVLVASVQNCVATHVTAVLRAMHGVNIQVVPSSEAHYIISRRVAVLRVRTANLMRLSYKQLLEEAVLVLCAHYPRPVLILEDGQPTSDAAVVWSRLAISRLTALLHARVHLLFSSTQDDTANLLAMLARREHQEGHVIPPLHDRDLHSEIFRFILKLPGVNFVCALQLAQKFSCIADFLHSCSSLQQLQQVTGLSHGCASRTHLILSGVIQP